VYVNEIHADSLKVSFLDVGQGDATLIETPNRQKILIDGGQSNSPILSRLGEVIPFYRRRINIVIATHPDADHIGGLPKVIERYEPQLIFESGVHVDTWIDKSLQNVINERSIPSLRARKGMKILSGNVSLEILFPDRNVDSWIKKTNDASIVARLEYGSTSFMFMGDSPVGIEHLLTSGNSLMHTDVLKVGHHGSRTSTSDEFVKSISPRIAIISSGKKNRYGHPHEEVLHVLEKNMVEFFRTDVHGTVQIQSDGEQLHID
jgi:competence protein ComEC